MSDLQQKIDQIKDKKLKPAKTPGYKQKQHPRDVARAQGITGIGPKLDQSQPKLSPIQIASAAYQKQQTERFRDNVLPKLISMIEQMAEGASDDEMAHFIGYDKHALYKWADGETPNREQFAEAWAIGRRARAAFWQKLTRNNLYNKDINNLILTRSMENLKLWKTPAQLEKLSERVDELENNNAPTPGYSREAMRDKVAQVIEGTAEQVKD